VELSTAAPASLIELEHEAESGAKIKNVWNNIPYCLEL
jgi:hypothetical protein